MSLLSEESPGIDESVFHTPMTTTRLSKETPLDINSSTSYSNASLKRRRSVMFADEVGDGSPLSVLFPHGIEFNGDLQPPASKRISIILIVSGQHLTSSVGQRPPMSLSKKHHPVHHWSLNCSWVLIWSSSTTNTPPSPSLKPELFICKELDQVNDDAPWTCCLTRSTMMASSLMYN